AAHANTDGAACGAAPRLTAAATRHGVEDHGGGPGAEWHIGEHGVQRVAERLTAQPGAEGTLAGAGLLEGGIEAAVKSISQRVHPGLLSSSVSKGAGHSGCDSRRHVGVGSRLGNLPRLVN